MNLQEKIKNRKHKSVVRFFKYELTSDEQNYLIDKYTFTDNIIEMCYCELYNILNRPKCKYCDNDSIFINFVIGYKEYCNDKQCIYKHKKEMMQKHFGVSNVFQLESVKNKCKNTMLKKYGVDNISKSEEIKTKKKNTCLTNYGVTNGFLTENAKQGMIKKYGVDHNFKIDNFYELRKLHNLEKYGYKETLQLPEIRKQIEKTCIKKYGVKNVGQLSEIINKIYKTKKKNKTFNTSKLEEQCYLDLLTKFNDIERQYKCERYPFACDFYIKSLDTFIEIQGTWFHGNHPFNENDKNDLELLNKWKQKTSNNYKRAIDTWTIRDVRKRNIAKENNLNYLEFFNYEQFKEWLNKQ